MDPTSPTEHVMQALVVLLEDIVLRCQHIAVLTTEIEEGEAEIDRCRKAAIKRAKKDVQ